MRLEDRIVEKLIDKNITIAVAESCTGGIIASRLISVAGISACFIEGLVTYSNDAKIKRLGVKRETIDMHGAVSKETVDEMLRGLESDVGVAVSGIAGPGGGTPEKPVGTIWIGVRIKNNIQIQKLSLHGARDEIRNQAADILLELLLNKL